MLPFVDFLPSPTMSYGAPTVATRARWEDEWTPRPHFYPLEASWSLAPAMPTATLAWRYGPVLHPGYPAWVIEERLDIRRQYIRIRFPAAPDPADRRQTPRYRDWYGVLELTEDTEIGGRYSRARNITTITPSGRQIWVAYGLESILANTPIRNSWINVGGTATQIQRPLVFNRHGKPNRTAELVGDPTERSHLFEPDASVAEFWSTRDIVDYLLTRCLPRDSAGDLKLIIHQIGPALQDWDKPHDVSQDRSTVYSLLNQLVTRQFMLGWRLVVQTLVADEPDVNVVRLETVSLNASDISLPLIGAPAMAGSTRVRFLNYDLDPFTRARVKSSDVELYDQVVMRGARKRTVATFSYADGTLTTGWSSGLETAYETAASTESGYSSLEDEEKRRRNAEARSSPRLEEVYTYFKIPDDWNRMVRDGVFGVDESPAFPDGEGNSKDIFARELYVLPTLPLFQGLDYSGTNVETGAPTVTEFTTAMALEEMPPLVAFQRPGTSRWVAAEKIGQVGTDAEVTEDNNNLFSCSVQVPHECRGIMLRVVGAPQHVIMPDEFTALEVDETVEAYNWRDMVVTLALAWDEHVEGVWPDTLPGGLDAPRVKVIDAGDRYRKDYVAPGTVVAIHTDGSLLRSTTGGWIPAEDEDDDEAHLTALARIAYEWYGSEHSALYLVTHHLPASQDLDVGDLIYAVGDVLAAGTHLIPIRTVITEIRITWPESDDSQAQPPTFQLVTDCGELDPVQAFGDKPAWWRGTAPKVDGPLIGPDRSPISFV